MAANRLPASLMKALDPAAGARRSRLTAARAGAPRCPYISRRSRPTSGQTLTVPSSFRRGELPRRLRAPFPRNVIPGAHAADRARGRSRAQSLRCAAGVARSTAVERSETYRSVTGRCEEAFMKCSPGPVSVALVALLVAVIAAAPPAPAEAPAGQVTWAIGVSLPPAWFDPAEATGLLIPFAVYYALQDALVKPMPGNAMAPSLAESWSASPDR